MRALLRRAEAAEEMTALGAAEVAVGDLFDSTSLRAAVEGCAKVLHICPPMTPQEADLGRTITDLCLETGVGHLVLYSVLHPLLDDVPHHANKLEAERYLINSGQPYTILQPARYMQHLSGIWNNVMRSGVHDMPFGVEARFSIVDLKDLTEAVATVLTEPGHLGATYQLAGPEALNQIDMARIISEVTGKTVTARAKPLDVFIKAMKAAGLPAYRIETMAAMNRHYDKHGLVGNPNVLAWLLGRAPTDFAAFIRRELAHP